ncbi:hypothetical protein JNK13_01735 [bacterium]|nr:hypothetical protein [bacterium]
MEIKFLNKLIDYSQRFRHAKYLKIIIVLFLGVILALTITSSLGQLGLAARVQPGKLLQLSLISLIFSVLRAIQWNQAALNYGHREALSASIGTQFRATFVDLTVFPARISSDIYRYQTLSGISAPAKLRTVATYRLSTMIPLILVIFYALCSEVTTEIWSLFLALLGLSVGLVIYRIFRRYNFFNSSDLILLAKLAALGVLALLVDLFRSYLLISTFTVMPFAEYATKHLIAQGIGALSGLPLGIGAKDLSLIYFFKSILTSPQVGAFIAVQRLTGELLGAFLGFLLSLKHK